MEKAKEWEPKKKRVKVSINEKTLTATVTGTLNPIEAMREASIAAKNCHPKLQINGWPDYNKKTRTFYFDLFYLLPRKTIFDP